MNTKNIRKQYDFTQRELAALFDIPLRTLEGWDLRDCMPDYMEPMIARCLASMDAREIDEILTAHGLKPHFEK